MPSEITPLQRNGLSQHQRRLPALDPSFARLDERTPDEMLAFAKQYAVANQVRFFPTDAADDFVDTTTWPQLLTAPVGQLREELEARADNPPHLALFLAFLKLFGLAQDQLNAFTQRHLDFYYRDVLQLRPQPAIPDQVHLTFELARNVAEHLLPVDSGFDAGPDASKHAQLYAAATARLVNRAQLGSLRTVYLNSAPAPTSSNPAPQVLFFAPQAATADGIAAPLSADDPTWSAFGPAAPVDTDADGIPDSVAWPQAQVGFALAAPVLRLAEGERTITVRLNSLNTMPEPGAVSPPLPTPLRVTVQLSGPTGWIDAGICDLVTVGTSGKTFEITAILDATEQRPVAGYNPAVHDGGYDTTAPVLRVLVKEPRLYAYLRELRVEIVEIDVQVKGLQKTLVLSNDFGPLDVNKPFLPFGTTPAVGSTLYVDSPETAGKALSSLRVYVPEWLNLPADWPLRYAGYGYGERGLYGHYPVLATIKNHIAKRNSYNLATDVQKERLGLFEQLQETDEKGENGKIVGRTLTTGPDDLLKDEEVYITDIADKSDVLQPLQPVGVDALVTFKLERDFGHLLYNRLMAQQALNGNGTAVYAPYTPVARTLLVDYKATSGKVKMNSASAGTFSQRNVRLFHQSIFGWAEEHTFLKRKLSFVLPNSLNAFLLPRYTTGGTFLLSLTEARPLDTVAVLFQVAEGSAIAGPRPTRVVWSVLCQNQWFELSGGYAPLDATDNLLTSGIIEFTLPAETTTTNTLMEPGQVWLRAELYLEPAPGTAAGTPLTPAAPDTVARLVGIHPQAVRARFVDQANDASHYAMPLPAGTVAKARPAVAALKAVRQPYAAFGGKPAETDYAFYTRVSERLRHKRRAVSIWDYEHLVLEQFNSLGKVQCLNHTRVAEASATKAAQLLQEPGYVTLVVVPRLDETYAAHLLAPRASIHTLQEVRDFVRSLAGQQVQVQVVNPVYQPVIVSAQVQLRPGYPAALYLPRLQQELRAYLAPWQRTPPAELSFGGFVERSSVVAFLDQRPYVDFVTDVTIQFQGQTTTPETLTATGMWSVLTSVATHSLDIYHPA